MDAIKALVFLALAATVVVLAWGVVSMAHGGKLDNAQANDLMRRRVFWQAVAVGLVLLTLLIELAEGAVI